MTTSIFKAAVDLLTMTTKDLDAMSRPAPTLPAIPTVNDLPSTVRAVSQIKEYLETWNGQRGSQVDAAVTWRDLIGTGIAAIKIGGTAYTGGAGPGNINVGPVGPQNDVTIPPAPTHLTAMGAIGNIILAWDRPGFHNFAYTEIWRSPADDIGQAKLVAQTPAWVYADAIGSGETFYYWIRFVSTANITGPYNAEAGTKGSAGYDASYLLDVLAANPPPGANYDPLLYEQSDPNLVIDGQPIPVGVYMNAAYIRNASISNAMIENLAVDNAKIADLDAVKITAGDIAADRMTANIVTAATGRFTTLSALSASLGTVQINSDGWLRSNGVASYTQGKGLYMDANVFRIGDPAGQSLWWDGNNLTLTGQVTAHSLATGAFSGYGWPANNGQGGYIGPEGALFGNNNNGAGTWFQYDANSQYIVLGSGNSSIFVQNGGITINGNAKFNGDITGANGTFNGTLRANIVDTNQLVDHSVSAPNFWPGIGGKEYGSGFPDSVSFYLVTPCTVIITAQMSASGMTLDGGGMPNNVTFYQDTSGQTQSNYASWNYAVSLGAGTHTLARGSAPDAMSYPFPVYNISVIGWKK